MPPLVETAPDTVFTTTHWSMVLSAASGSSSLEADAALSQLCRKYWPPLYSFLRWRGDPKHDAEDLVQGFFCRLLSKQYLIGVDPRKGKFRSFLLASIQNFTANEGRYWRTQKRGGEMDFISLDKIVALETELQLADSTLPPAYTFERQWAHNILELVFTKLKAYYVKQEKLNLFEALKPLLDGDKLELPYSDLAMTIGMNESALKTEVCRFRKLFRKFSRQEVANTLADPTLVDEELRVLCLALG